MGRVWIEFESSDDARRFLNAAAGEYDTVIDSLYNRIAYGWGNPLEVLRRYGNWEYDLSLIDENVHVEPHEAGDGFSEESVGPPSLRFRVGVAFPRTDLAEVGDALRQTGRSES